MGEASPVPARRRAARFSALPPTAARALIALPVLAVLFMTLLRMAGIERSIFAWALSFTPYVGLASVAVVALSFVSRSYLVVGLAAVCAVVQLSWLVPLYVAAAAPASGKTLTVMTTNLRFGEGSSMDVVSEVTASGVELLAVEELNQAAVDNLHDSGLDRLLPYRLIDPQDNYTGTGLWSKYPISNSRIISTGQYSPILTAKAAVPGHPLTFVVAHPLAPDIKDSSGWFEEQAELRNVLRELTGPVVLAGDLNATLDHEAIRNLVADGYADAAEQAGAGIVRTFPNGHGFPFPLFGIDHVMTTDPALIATDVRTAEITSSDHLALIVTYTLTTP